MMGYYTPERDALEGAGGIMVGRTRETGQDERHKTQPKGALKQTGGPVCSALCEATTMAIYHCSVKLVKRSVGRSATAASAYRSGDRIVDQRTGEIHDYTRRSGVESAELVFPDHVTNRPDRERLWNTAETAETRKNAQVAREVEIALPDELTAEQRRELAVDFAQRLAGQYRVAADVCIHKPGREGDQRNHHAHIMLTTREITPDGQMGAKTRILDDRKTGPAEIKKIREMWAQVCNAALEQAGQTERIDHRSLREQGEERQATKHQGPAVTAIERRNVAAVIRREHEDRRLEHIISREEYTQQRRADGNIPAVTRIGEINQAIREIERLERRRPRPAQTQTTQAPAGIQEQPSSMPQEQTKAKPAAGQGKPSLGQGPQQDPAVRPRPEVLSPLEELARTLREAGLLIEGDPVMNGERQSVPVQGGKPGARDGHYRATMAGDHPNGTWQNWKTGEQGKWIYTGQILTEEALQELRRQAEMTSEKQQRQQDQKHEPIPSPQKQPTSAELRAELDRIEAEIARLRPRYPGESPHVRRAIEEHKRTKEEYKRQDVDVFHIRREFESLNQHVAAHPIKSRLDGSAEELKQRKRQLEEEQKKLERLQWKLKETEKAKERAILDEQKKIAAEQTPERTARLESLEKQAKRLREQLHAAREREWRQERQQGRERDGGFSR